MPVYELDIKQASKARHRPVCVGRRSHRIPSPALLHSPPCSSTSKTAFLLHLLVCCGFTTRSHVCSWPPKETMVYCWRDVTEKHRPTGAVASLVSITRLQHGEVEKAPVFSQSAGLLEILPQLWIIKAQSRPEHHEQNLEFGTKAPNLRLPSVLSKLLSPAMLQE